MKEHRALKLTTDFNFNINEYYRVKILNFFKFITDDNFVKEV